MDFTSVCCPVSKDKSNPGCVVRKCDYSFGEMGGGTVTSVEAVEEGAQHTALWRTSAECDGGGEVGARSNSLGAVGQDTLDPVADRLVLCQ